VRAGVVKYATAEPPAPNTYPVGSASKNNVYILTHQVVESGVEIEI
jgi:hypothetical protein